MRGKTFLIVLIVGLGLAALTIKYVAKSSGTALPIITELPGFLLIDQNGNQFGLAELTRTATVVDFFFSRCMGPCPMMAIEMGKLQQEFAGNPNIRFVSISVDPQNDTPEVMTEYARGIGAMPDRWFFLTGPADSIVALSEKGFKLPALALPVEHSTHFVLVDKKGRIRGYYDSTDDKSMKILAKDIDRLLRSREG